MMFGARWLFKQLKFSNILIVKVDNIVHCCQKDNRQLEVLS